MLKLTNANGDVVMKLHDDGSEEFTDKKVKEQAEEARKVQEAKGEK